MINAANMVVITTETKMGKSFVDVLNALMVRTKTRRMIPERRTMNLRQKKKLFNKKSVGIRQMGCSTVIDGTILLSENHGEGWQP